MFQVYVDWTLEECPRPFYVGKGNALRVLNLERNEYHTNVKRKHGLRREIVFETSSENEAYEREVKLIAELHTFINDVAWNGIGTNMTPGGEGIRNPSPETREKLAANGRKGNAVRWARAGSRALHAAKHRVYQNLPDVVERKKRESSMTMRDRWSDPEERERLIQRQNDPEVRRKKSEAMKRAWERKRVLNTQPRVA